MPFLGCETGLGQAGAAATSWIAPALQATIAVAGLTVEAFRAISSYDLQRKALSLAKRTEAAKQQLALEQLAIVKLQMENEERRAQKQTTLVAAGGGGLLLLAALALLLGRAR